MRTLLCLIILVAAQSLSAQWVKQTVDTTASLRGLSVVNEKVVWASGTGGTVIRTIDGGRTWWVMTVPGAEKLDFRDIEAFDEHTAYILSIGNGELSRIYKTTDGGKTWKLEFQNKDEKAFFDAIACWDREACIALSDPVDGKFRLLKRTAGWTSNISVKATQWSGSIFGDGPAAKDGEAAFAASGTCLITQGRNNVFFVTGGSTARVFRSNDRAKTWLVAETPIIKGTPGSGIFSIAMYDDNNGVIVGGNYEKPDETPDTSAVTSDGGKTWIASTGLRGYRSGVSYLNTRTMLLAVGTNGADASATAGRVWQKSENWNFNSVQSVWAVGPNGMVATLSIKLQYYSADQ